MKTSPVALVLVAVVSSLATVGTLELLRGSRPVAQPAPALEPEHEAPVARAPREVEALVPAQRVAAQRVPDPPTGDEERLVELERRIAALELGSTTRRAPVTSVGEEPPPKEDLRELVLEWVAEEREARWRADEIEGEEEHRKELEFQARHQALLLAQEHGLPKWQEEEFAKLFLEMGVRADEIERSIDYQTDDPEEVEERWLEFDEWIDQRERELTALLDPALYAKIYGDD